jgi:ribose 5-phosphate isomerase A
MVVNRPRHSSRTGARSISTSWIAGASQPQSPKTAHPRIPGAFRGRNHLIPSLCTVPSTRGTTALIDTTLAAKQRAAKVAAALVEEGMLVGLGSGSTAGLVVRALGDRIADEGLGFVAVPTSVATAELAHEKKIILRELDDVDRLDLNLDGADEVDSSFRMIKGRGGALLREKLVASVARRRVTVITLEKRVERLGQSAPIPVEVSAVGWRHVALRLRELGAETVPRLRPDGTPFVTDGGNRIIDCWFPPSDDLSRIDCLLQKTVGVFETGLFLNLCDVLIVGHSDRVEVIEQAGRADRSSWS